LASPFSTMVLACFNVSLDMRSSVGNPAKWEPDYTSRLERLSILDAVRGHCVMGDR
jgi:hypothetical protein